MTKHDNDNSTSRDLGDEHHGEPERIHLGELSLAYLGGKPLQN